MAHGLKLADIRSTASATTPLVDAPPAASVGAVATGSMIAVAPPAGAEAAEVASAGTVAGPLPPLTVALAGAPPLPPDAGCVARVVEPMFVGKLTAGTIAGTAPTTGVSPEPLIAPLAAPEGVAAASQLPLAVALVALSRPAAAPVGTTAQGSVAAVASVPMLDNEASATAEAVVGLVTSGVVAPAAATCGSPSMTGATSASSAVAAGMETSGIELVVALAETLASVSGADVSGIVTVTSAVVGAVTTGWATLSLATAAGGC
jgi:hypothetical protein